MAAKLIALGAVVSPKDYEALVIELNTLKANAAVTALVNEKKLPPALRDWAIKYCASGEAGFREFAEKLTPMVDDEEKPQDDLESTFWIMLVMAPEQRNRLCACCGRTWREHVARIYVWGLDDAGVHTFVDLCAN